jgi:hypothetical protein
MLGLGVGMEEGILQARGVPGAIFEAVPLAQRLGSFIVCLMPLLLVAWGYYGSRVYSYTKSGIAFAAIFAVFSYAFINIVLALLTPLGKQALFPEGSFNILATMGAALTAVVLPAIGLAIGILIGWLRSGRSLARINTYIRGLATDKRNEAYLVLVAYFEEQSRRRDATTVVVEPPPANAQ